MTQLVGSKTANGSLAGDRRDAQIEAQRGVILSAAVDRSYDQIEAQRGAPVSRADVLDRGADRGVPTTRSPRGIATTTRSTRRCRRLPPASSSSTASTATFNRNSSGAQDEGRSSAPVLVRCLVPHGTGCVVRYPRVQ